jgi:tripartite-type tricarboxylate transporter receptor subunit TctC
MACATLGYSLAAPAQEAQADDFYKGKRVTIIVGSGAGGGYDTYARLVGRHLGKHIPGEPTFIVQNMPGAASINAVNHMVKVAPQDGTVIGAIQRDAAMVQILGKPGPQFKAAELHWIGNLVTEPGVCGVASRTGIKSFEEVFKRQVLMGSSGPNALEHYPALFNNILGAKFKVVRGYKASTEVGLALERGEVEGVCQSAASFMQHHAHNIEKGTVKILVQVALKPIPELQKRGVPLFKDFITKERLQGGMTDEDAISFFNLQLATTMLGRPYVMAPAVANDRVELVRKGFADMANSAPFQADAKAQKRDIDLVTGKELEDIIKNISSLPKAKLDKLQDLLKL